MQPFMKHQAFIKHQLFIKDQPFIKDPLFNKHQPFKGGHFTPVGDTINHWLLESTQCRPGQCILQAGVYHC